MKVEEAAVKFESLAISIARGELSRMATEFPFARITCGPVQRNLRGGFYMVVRLRRQRVIVCWDPLRDSGKIVIYGRSDAKIQLRVAVREIIGGVLRESK